MNAPGRWRTGVGVAMWDAMGCRRRGPQDRISGVPLLKTRLVVRGEGRRSTVGGLLSVVDGSSFASAAFPSCAEATESHQAIATSMGSGLSSRVESRAWKSSSRNTSSRSWSKERAAAGRWDEMAIWMLDGGWLAVDRPVWSWPDAAGLVWEVWEVRRGLADCSSPMQSTQFLCRGGGQLKQSSWSRKAGPQFSVETRTWRAGPSS